ncbi:MAG: CBS domain-containing protein [Chthonomonadales bacterium]
MKLFELMKVHVVTASPSAKMSELIDLMDLYQLSHIPIVDRDKTPYGIVMIDAIVSELNRLKKGNEFITAETLMIGKDFALDEQADSSLAEDRLKGNPLRRICVTSNGILVGTVGWVELCQNRINSAAICD